MLHVVFSSLVKLLIFGHYLWPFLGKLSREIIFISFYLSVKYILQCADQGRGKLDDLHQDPLLVVVVAVVRCNFLKHQWGKYLCIKDLIHHGDFQGKGFKMAPRSDKSELLLSKSRPPKEWCEKKSSNISCCAAAAGNGKSCCHLTL